jgi:hypothetical protein
MELYIGSHPDIPDVSTCAVAGMTRPVIIMAMAIILIFFISLVF